MKLMIYFHFHLKKESSGRPLADQMESLRRGASPELYHFTTTCHKLATQFVTICNDQINHYALLPSISFIEEGRKSNSPLKALLTLVSPSMKAPSCCLPFLNFIWHSYWLLGAVLSLSSCLLWQLMNATNYANCIGFTKLISDGVCIWCCTRY